MSGYPDDVPFYPGLNSSDARQPASVSRAINNLLQGSLNVTRNLQVGLADVSPVTIQDSRIHQFSFIHMMVIGTTEQKFEILAVREGEVDIGWTGTLSAVTNARLLIIG